MEFRQSEIAPAPHFDGEINGVWWRKSKGFDEEEEEEESWNGIEKLVKDDGDEKRGK